MTKLKIVLVGLGNWGMNWLPFLKDAEDWELSGVVAVTPNNFDKACEKTGLELSQCYTDLDAALKTDADAVLITTPHHLHVPLARKALEAGKHVLCEKPFSDDFVAARELVRSASGSHLKLGINQNFRYREALWQMQAGSQGALGPVDSLNISFYMPQGKGPMKDWRKGQVSLVLLEIAIHHFDMARFLLGENAKTVYSHAWNPPRSQSSGPANAATVIEFESGAVLHHYASWASQGCKTGWEGDWIVQFENGGAQWKQSGIEFFNSDGQQVDPPPIEGYPGTDRKGALKKFAATVRNDVPFPSSGEDNLNSLAIVFAAIKSFQERREVTIREILEQ